MATKPRQTVPLEFSKRPARLFCVVVMIVLAATMLANSMIKPVSRDEQMYCTAGVLMARGLEIYRDFAYPSQLPYHPLLLATLYRLFGTSHYLLVGRLVSVVCDIGVLIAIVGIYRSIFADDRRMGIWLGTIGAALYAFNPMVDYAAGYAWNHDVVALCVMLSLWLFVTVDFQSKGRFVRLALIGALLTFATCMRVTTALVEVFFLPAVCLAAGGRWQHRVRAVLPLTLAAFIVLIWPVWIAIRAGQAFWLNLIHVPALYGRWLREIGMIHSKVSLTVAALTTPGYLVLMALTVFLLWVLLRHRARVNGSTKTKALVVALVPVIFFVVAYIPPTMWRQYLAIPVPFLVVALAYPLGEWLHMAKAPFRLASGAMGLSLAVTVMANPTPLSRTLAVLAPEYWTPVTLHQTSADIAGQVAAPKRILTLGPLYALEGGGEIYRELACGSIIYRTADALSAEQRKQMVVVGPKSLPALVAKEPPQAVILGIEPEYFAFLEEPLRRVVKPNWPRDVYEGVVQAYIRPAAAP